MYQIKPYSFIQADKIGVIIAPSNNKKYKIDIYDKHGNLITQIGATGYSDFPTYVLSHGIEYANDRRRLYKIRHQSDRNKLYSRGWFSDQILW